MVTETNKITTKRCGMTTKMTRTDKISTIKHKTTTKRHKTTTKRHKTTTEICNHNHKQMDYANKVTEKFVLMMACRTTTKRHNMTTETSKTNTWICTSTTDTQNNDFKETDDYKRQSCISAIISSLSVWVCCCSAGGSVGSLHVCTEEPIVSLSIHDNSLYHIKPWWMYQAAQAAVFWGVKTTHQHGVGSDNYHKHQG